MTKTNSEILDQLRTAADGLLMMSESEYPFEVFLWEDAAPATPEKRIKFRKRLQIKLIITIFEGMSSFCLQA